MSNDHTLPISFFQSCDRVFELYAINDEFKVPVIMLLLTDKVRLLHTNIPAEEIRSFEGLKLALTRKFRLTFSRYRKLLNEAERGVDESYVNLSTRLSLNFTYYMDCCKVDKDYDKLVNLIIRDKLHSLMNSTTREKLREYSIGTGQQSYYDVAVVADEYETDKPVFQSFVKNGAYKHGATNSSDITNKKNAILDCWRCKQKNIPGAKCTFNPPRVDGTNNSRWGAANANQGGAPFAPKGNINSRLQSMASNSNFPFLC